MDRAAAAPVASPDPAPDDKSAEKCGPFEFAPEWTAYGGAQSFADYDAYQRSMAATYEIESLTNAFSQMVTNVLRDETKSLAQKASAIVALGNELGARVGDADGEDVGFAEYQDKSRGGLLQRFFGRKAPRIEVAARPSPPAPAAAPVFPPPPAAGAGAFSTFKDAETGAWRWLAVWSNNFEDREEETFSLEAHREFCDYANAAKAYPELWLWHVPGSRVGQADLVDLDSSGFVIASGTYDAGKEQVAENLRGMAPLGVSHAFHYQGKDLRGGVFHRYRTFEISPLPLARAANSLTGFVPGTEGTMLSKDRREFLEKAAGPSFVSDLEARLGEMADKAHAEGISYKQVGDALAGLIIDVGEQKAAAETTQSTPGAFDLTALKGMLDTALAPIGDKLTAVEAKVDQHGAAIADLQKSDDEKTARTWMPKSRPLNGKAASASKDNIVDDDDEDAKAAKENGGIPAHLAPYADLHPVLNHVLNGSGN